MQKQEFEERIERTVTDEQYKVIEEVYMWHPSIRNTSGKDEVAELYKSFGMTIFHLFLMGFIESPCILLMVLIEEVGVDAFPLIPQLCIDCL